MDKVLIENVDIPIESDNINLKGSIYYSSNTPSKAPWIIVLGGILYHRESKFIKYYSENFANAGYYVLSFDYRGHGGTAKETGKLNYYEMVPKIYLDIHEVISWILENQANRILKENIVLFGMSFGGAIILTQGYKDERAKTLILLCTRYDYSSFRQFPQDLIENMSPKFFIEKNPVNNERILIGHCKDDKRVPFENVIKIKEHLGLSDDNVMIFDEGGHSFNGKRDKVFERSIKFLKKYKKEKK